jgi:uncharacterized tellurite resistance protein B-like protein
MVAAGLADSAVAVPTNSVMPNLGNPTPQHLRYAVEWRESLTDTVRDAAHDPHQAVALLYCLVLSADDPVRQSQLDELSRQLGPEVRARITALWPELATTVPHARLPLVNLALPALRQLRPDEFQQFLRTLDWLIESDEQIVLFEFMLQKIVRRQIEPFFVRQRPAPIQYYSIQPLRDDCAILLSALAHTGHTDAAEIKRAFATGLPSLRLSDGTLDLLTGEQCDLNEINRALDRLAQAAPQSKKNLLEACIQVVGADGVIHENEAELLRAIAETLDCPIPPFIMAA